jgi:ligand-binding sensor domain-containing protein
LFDEVVAVNRDAGTGRWPGLLRVFAASMIPCLVRTISWRRYVLLAIAVPFAVLSAPACAERLPTHTYTTADGLPSNQITCVKRDSHGFLWFCTPEGLSRFDGFTFTNYGIDQGLPDRVVTDLLETREGDYWVATPNGVALFSPKPRPDGSLFTSFDPRERGYERQVNTLFEDHSGTIWIGTVKGVVKLAKTGESWSFHRSSLGVTSNNSAEEILEDRDNNLWIAIYGSDGDTRLCELLADGRYHEFQDGFFKGNRILSMLQDRRQRIWLGTYRGLALLAPHPDRDRPVIRRVYGARDGLAAREVPQIYESSDGRLWVTAGGVYEIEDDRPGGSIRFRQYARPGETEGVEAEDAEGNFWGGRTRIVRGGFATYGRADGLADENIRSVFEAGDGTLYVVAGYHNRFLQRFDGRRFFSVAPRFLGDGDASDWGGWGWGQIHLRDHLGEWWIATGHGLLRYPRVERLEELAHTMPRAVYTARQGLKGNQIFRLFEDRRGDIWIGDWGSSAPIRWDRSTKRFHTYTAAEGWNGSEVTAFAEDAAGDLWMGERIYEKLHVHSKSEAISKAFRRGIVR